MYPEYQLLFNRILILCFSTYDQEILVNILLLSFLWTSGTFQNQHLLTDCIALLNWSTFRQITVWHRMPLLSNLKDHTHLSPSIIKCLFIPGGNEVCTHRQRQKALFCDALSMPDQMICRAPIHGRYYQDWNQRLPACTNLLPGAGQQARHVALTTSHQPVLGPGRCHGWGWRSW